MSIVPDRRLPCGTDCDSLLAHVADGAPLQEHQRSCPHCGAAIAELRSLWAPVDELAAEGVQAPASLLGEIMARIREVARNTWYATVRTEKGQTRVAAWVIGVVVRLAAQEVAAVVRATGTGTPEGLEDRSSGDTTPGARASGVGVSGTHVVIDVQIAARLGAPLAVVAEEVKRRVAERIAAQLELVVAEVNVTVADVVP